MKEGGMGKRLGLRISRVLPSFQTCRLKDPELAVVSPAFRRSPANPKSRDIDFSPPPPTSPPRATHRHPAPAIVATGCCRPRPPRANPVRPWTRETLARLWSEEKKRGATADGGATTHRKTDSDKGGDFLLPRPRKEAEDRRRRPGKKKKSRSRGRTSTSSADSGWFSSEDEANDEREDDDDDDGDETETLLSSFETDSSEVMKRRGAGCFPSPETGSPERAEAVVRRVAAGAAEGKVAEGFAVVKRSEDPRGDFRRSMAEMVLEKGIYDAAGLEELLHCFLSLNSGQHHAAIVAAFVDIWDAIFPASPAITFPYTYHE